MKHQPETEEQRIWYWRGYAAGVNGLAERVSELIERQFGVKLVEGRRR